MNSEHQEGYDAGQKLCSLGVATENPYKSGIPRIDWDEGYNDACSDYEQYTQYGGFV